MIRPRTGIVCLAAVLLAASVSPAAAQPERIHSYHSDVTVNRDGSLHVVETIRVTAAGRDIKRGIYREFPTLYRTKYLVQIEVPFNVISVRRNGQPEPFHTEEQRNGVRVYIGSENVILPHGEHVYELTYTTDHQLGHFDQHDELYWNVTGNGWAFPIAEATATVQLPHGVPINEVTHEGYTGPKGSKERALSSSVADDSGTVEFRTTAPLAPHEGLTIVVGFPKGHVEPPTSAELSRLYFRANLTLWVVLAGLFIVGGYYFAAWVAVGRDPPGRPIYPQFEPPLNLSPACVRYLRRMGYDKKCFTAAILSMAVKGHLTIEEDDQSKFTLTKREQNPGEKLSAGEQAVSASLLKLGSLKLRPANHKKISTAIEKLGERLKLEYDGKLFARNRKWLVPGWILSALVLVLAALSCGWAALPLVAFLGLWLSIWTLGCVVLGVAALALWRSALSLRHSSGKRFGSLLSAIGMTAFATPFFIGEAFGLGALVHNSSIWIVPLLVGLVAVSIAFWHLIKQPTVEGRRIMDDIEGFRMYLATAEEEMLQQLHPPEKTPELFERYLPYALALDVENQWAEKFTNVLAEAAAAPSRDGGYHPNWYHGSNWNSAATGAFATGLGTALGSAVSSASTAPGSSSGGGGGGSSGGGGGGGGGGGW